jgi:SH3-like domain-containing protein
VHICKVMFGLMRSHPLAFTAISNVLGAWRGVWLALATMALLMLPGLATAADNPSGLPLPRFASTRSTPINVRVGPGTKYGVAWIYVKAGLPVEIVAEFDTWRKIRDRDGQEGWVHQNLLSGKRAAYVTPWGDGETQIPIHVRADDTAGVRAYLSPDFRVEINQCDGDWCEVSAIDEPKDGRPSTYTGWLHQSQLWGVYENEKFD